MFGYLRIVRDASAPRAQSGESNRGHYILRELLGNPNSVPDVVQHFADLVTETGQLDVVFDLAAEQFPLPQFGKTVLRTLLNSGVISIPADLAGKNWRAIRESLNADGNSPSLEQFLKTLPEYEELVVSASSGEFDARESGLYGALVKGDASPAFVTWCARGLQAVNQETWLKEFKLQGDLLGLVIELQRRDTKLVLDVEYLDALIGYVEEIAGDLENVFADDTWHLLVDLLVLSQREKFARRAYRILEENDGSVNPMFFNLLGELLVDSGILADEQRFIDRVCSPIVDRLDETGIAWLAKLANTTPELLTRHRDGSDFTSRVHRSLNKTSVGGPIHQNLTKIRDALGFGEGFGF